MIFLDASHGWVLGLNRQELIDALKEGVDPDDNDHLLRFAAACLGCEEEEVMWVEF